MEKGKVKTPKAVWDAYATKIFCQICKEETLAGNRPGTTLSSIGYKNLEEFFFCYHQTTLPTWKIEEQMGCFEATVQLVVGFEEGCNRSWFRCYKGDNYNK